MNGSGPIVTYLETFITYSYHNFRGVSIGINAQKFGLGILKFEGYPSCRGYFYFRSSPLIWKEKIKKRGSEGIEKTDPRSLNPESCFFYIKMILSSGDPANCSLAE